MDTWPYWYTWKLKRRSPGQGHVDLCFPLYLIIPSCDYILFINTYITIFWQLEWTEINTNRATQIYKIFLLRSPSLLLPYRHDDVVFRRLLFGHIWYTNKHWIRDSNGILPCPHCNCHADLTVNHFLVECTGLSESQCHSFLCFGSVNLFRHIQASLVIDNIRDLKLYYLL